MKGLFRIKGSVIAYCYVFHNFFSFIILYICYMPVDITSRRYIKEHVSRLIMIRCDTNHEGIKIFKVVRM